MPAHPTVISSNISNVKVDGEVVPGLQEAHLKIESGQVQGTIKVKNSYKKFDSLLLAGNEKQKSFQIVVELKRSTEIVQTFSFPKCYLKSNQLTLDANGLALSEYFLAGSVSSGPKSTVSASRVNTSVQPHRIIR